MRCALAESALVLWYGDALPNLDSGGKMILARWRGFVAGVLSLFVFWAPQSGLAQVVLDEQDKNTLARLADMLENPEQRQAVLARLRDLATDGEVPGQQASTVDTTATTAPDEDAARAVRSHIHTAFSQVTSLPQTLAGKTAAITDLIGTRIKNSLSFVAATISGKDSHLQHVDETAFWRAFRILSLVIVVATLVFQSLRLMLWPLKRRLNVWSRQEGFMTQLLRRLIAIAAVSMMDVGLLGLTYLLGNAVTLYGIGSSASITLHAALFFNAFIVLELLKIAVRAIFSPRCAGLRLIATDTATARYGYRLLATLIDLVGYGYLVAVPLFENLLGDAFAQVSAILIAGVAFAYGLWGVLSRRRAGHAALRRLSERAHTSAGRFFLGFFARTWHGFALVYFLVLLVGTLLRAEKVLPFLIQGTVQTLVIVALAFLLSVLLTRLIARPISLPDIWQRNLPGVEQRLNVYMPPLVKLLRFLLPVVVLFALLGAWRVIDLPAWLTSDSDRVLLEKLIGVFWIVAIHTLIWLVAFGFIENWLSPQPDSVRLSARAETLLSLAKNALAILLGGSCLIMVLGEIGVNIGPLIAGAGVLGLAVGFGAQTLVKDVITGIFIQLENAMNTGDWVSVCGISGRAERISLRSVGLRDLEGTYHIIPFSSVTTVSNYMRGFAYHKGIYGIGYNEDIDAACEQLRAAFEELVQGDLRRHILEPIKISGVTQFADSSINIRILIKTTPGDQWSVGYAYNRLVKIYFDRAGIEIPYPHHTVYFGHNKGRTTPPLDIRTVREDRAPDNANENRPENAPRDRHFGTQASKENDAFSQAPDDGGE